MTFEASSNLAALEGMSWSDVQEADNVELQVDLAVDCTEMVPVGPRSEGRMRGRSVHVM